MKALETEIGIVGGGPTGLAASVALSRLGIDSVLLERHTWTSRHPKATVINVRSMELLRQWGLEERVRARAPDVHGLSAIRWVTRLATTEIGDIPLLEGGPAAPEVGFAKSPTLVGICPQDLLEPILRFEAERLHAQGVLFATEMTEFDQDESGATVGYRDSFSGDRGQVRCQYLLAADGGRSRIREELAIPVQGTELPVSLMSIHFRAALAPFVADRLSVLYWVINAGVRGVIHLLDGTDRWMLNTPFFPEQGQTPDQFTFERCAQLVRDAVGVDDLEVEVLDARPWAMEARIAERYRDGRVFLLGDAAHQFPPTGGWGMNTGLQDVHNLAWKLGGVLRGWAGEALLDSYERERRPVAVLNNEQSVENALTLGEQFFAVPDDELPFLDDEVRGPALQARIAEHIPVQEKHFRFEGQDLGFVYEDSSAIVPDGREPPQLADPISEYVPNARPGARAPHVWLERNGETISTLDLFEDRLVLLAGHHGERWLHASQELPAERPLSAFLVGPGCELKDPRAELLSLYGLEPDGAVLVRPDGHVGWRSRGAGVDPIGELNRAVATALGYVDSIPLAASEAVAVEAEGR